MNPHVKKDIILSTILLISTLIPFLLVVYFVYFHYLKKRKTIAETKKNIRNLLLLLESLSKENKKLHKEVKKAIKEFSSCQKS